MDEEQQIQKANQIRGYLESFGASVTKITEANGEDGQSVYQAHVIRMPRRLKSTGITVGGTSVDVIPFK